MGLRFLAYQPAAAPHVVRLWNESIGEVFPLREEVLRQCLEGNPSARPEDGCLAWADDERLVGFGYLGVHRLATPEMASFQGRAQIQAIIVHPELRRRGIGRLIAGHLTDVARGEGAARLE
ncbi:MAG TPA: GNAT family N-acetyltransferase, partial [Candidatus Deferrimicrobium sp.]|nr:GNAT family N-acetyltransferase [Candidatus Deferrimicrobium sp.]